MGLLWHDSASCTHALRCDPSDALSVYLTVQKERVSQTAYLKKEFYLQGEAWFLRTLHLNQLSEKQSTTALEPRVLAVMQ